MGQQPVTTKNAFPPPCVTSTTPLPTRKVALPPEGATGRASYGYFAPKRHF